MSVRQNDFLSTVTTWEFVLTELVDESSIEQVKDIKRRFFVEDDSWNYCCKDICKKNKGLKIITDHHLCLASIDDKKIFGIDPYSYICMIFPDASVNRKRQEQIPKIAFRQFGVDLFTDYEILQILAVVRKHLEAAMDKEINPPTKITKSQVKFDFDASM